MTLRDSQGKLTPVLTSVEEPEADQSPPEAGLSPSGSSLELTPASPEAEVVKEEVKTKRPGPRSPWDTRHEFAHVDRIFIISFPIAFASFNILYWTLCVYFQDYLRGSEDQK